MPSLFSQIQEWSCLALRLTGIPWLLREVYARRRVTIINYHDPSPEIFERHMELFARVYSFICIDELAEALEVRDFSLLPARPMLVTLDDGHVGNARLFETMRAYAIPVVIYAVAGVVDTHRGFWFNLLDHGSSAMHSLKSLPDAERREILKRDYGHTDEREYEMAAALSAGQLLEFLALGGTVGSHTLFHPLLDQCAEVVGKTECRDSRTRLEGMIGAPVRHFALPNGNSDRRVRTWVMDAGYSTCRTITTGWVTPLTDPFALPNFGVTDDAGLSKAVIQACGLWDVLKNLVNNLKKWSLSKQWWRAR